MTGITRSGRHRFGTLSVVAAGVVLVVSACSSSASPAPATGSDGSGGSTAGQFCSGTKIVFFPAARGAAGSRP